MTLCGIPADNIDRYRCERLGSQVYQDGSLLSSLKVGDTLLRPSMTKAVSSSPNCGIKAVIPILLSLVNFRSQVVPSV